MAPIEQQTRDVSALSVKQQLAAICHLFDWLVTGQIMPVNPAASVRGPSHTVKRGKTPVLEPAEARTLLDSIGLIFRRFPQHRFDTDFANSLTIVFSLMLRRELRDGRCRRSPAA